MTPVNETAAQKMARLEAEIAGYKAELAKKNAINALRCKITVPRAAGTFNADDKGSEGGACSVYNLQRMPVTLYKEQWIRFIGKFDDLTDMGFIPELKAFLKENEHLLKTKAAKTAKAA